MSVFLAFLLVTTAMVMFIGYKMYVGYYRPDICVDTAFSRDDMEVFTKYKRFVIVGCGCSGKSTLAKQLVAKYKNLTRFEMDWMWYLPKWNTRSEQEFKSVVSKGIDECDQNGWIFDGNYGRVRDVIWSKVEVVVWLQYDFRIVFYRSIKRTIGRIISGEKICNGNVESLWNNICHPTV